jgi:hypothetical protein
MSLVAMNGREADILLVRGQLGIFALDSFSHDVSTDSFLLSSPIDHT